LVALELTSALPLPVVYFMGQGEVKVAREIICGIYCIRNIVNDKRYIGKSQDIYGRWYDHISSLRNNRHKNEYLQWSWNKHGEENFEFLIIKQCIFEELNYEERFWINEYKTFGYNGKFGYNLDSGGGEGKEICDETRQKMSLLNKGDKNPRFGIPVLDVTRQRMSNSQKGKVRSEESRENLSKSKSETNHPFWGIKRSNATSEFFGVSYDKVCKNWASIVRTEKKSKRLGRYKTELEAAQVYDDYVFKHNLPNPLNFPEKYYNENGGE